DKLKPGLQPHTLSPTTDETVAGGFTARTVSAEASLATLLCSAHGRGAQLCHASPAEPRSETVVLDLVGDQHLEPLDVRQLLALDLAPEILQGRLPLGVGDVLVVAP